MINVNFIFKKLKSLALLFLLKIFKYINQKSLLYWTELNQHLSIILNYFLDSIAFIDILSKIFINISSFLLILLNKLFFLTSY